LDIIGLYPVFLAEFNPLQPVVPVPLFTFAVGSWQVVVSNHMFMVAMAALVLLILIPFSARSKGLVPKGLRNLIESVCVYLRDEMAKPVMGENTDRYIGFVWTVFFFILTLNLLGMVPTEKIIVLLTGKENSLGGPATANIWITGAMAVVAFCMTHIAGVREQGLWRYIVNFVPPVPWWMLPMVYFLEIISALVRPFALAIRLFANIIAGHILLATFIGLILVFKNYGAAAASILGAVALSVLELLVAFIQAYIFAFLSTIYIGSSITAEH
jgi:F-type H+-transporting ATPase subunit a